MKSVVLSVFKKWEESGFAGSIRERFEVQATSALAKRKNRLARREAQKDAASGFSRMRESFQKNLGYELNLENPVTRNEKIQWRKVYDRRPVLQTLCDKGKSKRWITERVGSDRLVPSLFEVSSPLELPRDIGCRDVILKCSHASGRMIVCGRPETPSFGGIVRRLGYWSKLDYGVSEHEWAYTGSSRKIVVESMLRNEDGSPPYDAKFHMHDGEIAIITCLAGDVIVGHEKVSHSSATLLTADWEVSEVRRVGDVPNEHIPIVPYLDEMKQVARELSKGLDYVRVDFLMLQSTFFIGELTLYDNSGMKPFETYEMDKALGDAWTLPSLESVQLNEELRAVG